MSETKVTAVKRRTKFPSQENSPLVRYSVEITDIVVYHVVSAKAGEVTKSAETGQGAMAICRTNMAQPGEAGGQEEGKRNILQALSKARESHAQVRSYDVFSHFLFFLASANIL